MGNNSINERNYENARRNSVGYDKKTKYTKYVKIPVAHIKNAAMATLLAASIIAGGHIAPKLVEAKNDNAIVYEQLNMVENSFLKTHIEQMINNTIFMILMVLLEN